MIPIGVQFEAIVATMREEIDGPPYFMYGHRREINARLQTMDKNVEKREDKYPLIVLILDVPEPKVGDVTNFNLHLVVITPSSPERHAEQRVVDIIEPTLYPIYEMLCEAIVSSGLFMWSGDPSWPPHTKFDRPNWGRDGEDGTDGQFLSDKVDAVEMINLSINQSDCHDIELPVVAMELPDGVVIDKGTWNPQENGGQLPTVSGIENGWEWHIVLTDKTTPAVFDGVDLWDGMKIRAKVDAPGQIFANYYYE